MKPIPIHPTHQLLSFGVFIAILVGLFFTFTVSYPSLVNLQRQNSPFQTTPPDTTSPQMSKEQQLAPFVRGVLDGVRAAFESARPIQKALAINKVEGYQKGAAIAIITSMNWINLDRELFGSSGLLQGVETAIAQSKRSPLQFQMGYQLKLVEQIHLALNTNIESLLDQSGSRQRTFTQYVGELKTLLAQAQVELEQLRRQLTQYKSDWDSALNQQQAAGTAFAQNAQQYLVQNIEGNIKEFEAAGTEAVRARAMHNAYLNVFKNLSPLVERLPAVITALEANEQALVLGIKVKPTPGVNLPIYKE